MIDFFKKKVMVIAPHMDDEVIGCSGTLLLNSSKLESLSVIHMTSDQCRLSEYAKVAQLLNVKKHVCLDAEDGFVNNSYRTCVLKLIKIIQQERPDIVFIPHAKDDHVDHIATNQISLDAILKARYWDTGEDEWKVNTILEYEVWSFQDAVSEIIDISEVVEDKKNIMSIYQSQLGFNYIQFIEYCNGYRGLLYNRGGYAECFRTRKV